MPFVTCRFYAELNDHLAPGRRGKAFPVSVEKPVTVSDLIESCKVPSSKVDLVLVNSEPAGLGRLVSAGDRVSVYPRFQSVDITPVRAGGRP